jgi:hypothetical protein
VALNWKQIYLNDNRLLKASDYVVAGWQIAGLMGRSSAVGVEVIMIGAKTISAGQDGAYLYVARKDNDFSAASAYLKNPATEQTFAHIVEDVRQNRPLPPGAETEMVRVARSLNAPQTWANKTGTVGNIGIMWDEMTSPEAVSAMFRRASIEVAASVIGHGMEPGVNKLLEDQAQRKAMFDGIRLERNAAKKMLEFPGTTEATPEQIKKTIVEADKLSAKCFEFEKSADRVVNTANGLALGDATDRITKVFFPDETPVHRF